MKNIKFFFLLNSFVTISFLSYGQVYVNDVDLNSEVKMFELHMAKKPFSTKDCYYIDYGQKDFKEHYYDHKTQAVLDKDKTKFEKGEYMRLLNYLDAQGWVKDTSRESELGDVKINIILFKKKE